MSELVWTALAAVLFLTIAVVSAVIAYFGESWLMMAYAGVMALVGMGLAMLSLRER